MFRHQIREALTSFRPNELSNVNRRESGVLLLMHQIAGVEHLVFQHRTERVRYHKGQISFPGGARDTEDGTLLETALRETKEEIGVSGDLIEIYGRLDDTVTGGTNYLIRPFVGVISSDVRVEFVEAEREVRELFHVPVAHLLSEEARAWKAVEQDGSIEITPAYAYGAHIIWGATARMLSQFLELIEPAARHG